MNLVALTIFALRFALPTWEGSSEHEREHWPMFAGQLFPDEIIMQIERDWFNEFEDE